MPTFPLATLAAQVTATGISAPSYSDILNSLIASFQAIYGSDAYLQPDGQDYQLLAVFAQGLNDCNQAIIAVYNGVSPAFAQGAGLDAIVKVNGLVRQIPTNSTATVTIVGVAGTVITNGVVRDTSNNLWNLPATVTIPAGGSIDVTATAQVTGAISAPANTINIIETPTQGWQTVNNAVSATVGAPVETDAALRRRQATSTGLPAQTPLSAIAAAVANVVGVQRSAVYENQGATTDANGIPSHSIAVVVQGGDITQVATVIEEKKSPGTGTFGTTTVTITDPSGVPIPINFYQLTQVTVYVSVTVHALNSNFNSVKQAAIQTAIVNFINALPIGDSVYFNWLMGIATLNGDVSFRVTGLTLGTAPSPAGTADIAIAFNQAAITDATKVVITVA